MLFSVKNLYGYRLGATDGLAGGIADIYFNDQDWSIRHLMISQHPARLQKAALLPPSAVRQLDPREGVMHIDLSRAQCAALPSANSVVPVCRQYIRLASPGSAAASFDPHIRCVSAVEGNEINDGETHLGIVHDFLIDPRTWTLAFVVGRRFGAQAQERDFLAAASSISQISFATRRVTLKKASHWDLVFEARNGYDRALEAVAA